MKWINSSPDLPVMVSVVLVTATVLTCHEISLYGWYDVCYQIRMSWKLLNSFWIKHHSRIWSVSVCMLLCSVCRSVEADP